MAQQHTVKWFYLTLTISLVIFGCLQHRSTWQHQPAAFETCSRSDPRWILSYLVSTRPPELRTVKLWPNDLAEGLELTSDHYRIYTTLMAPLVLRQVPAFLEAAYAGYNAQVSRAVSEAEPFLVYLFADRRQWESFTRRFAPDQADVLLRIRAGAYCYNGACVAYNIGRSRTLSALGHEGWHQFNSRHFRLRPPSWLDEGIAMLFEHFRLRDGRFEFLPAQNIYRLQALKTTLVQHRMIPLRQLVAMNPGQVLATDQSQDVMAFYSQAYALVRFLQSGKCGIFAPKLRKLLADGLAGDWPIDPVSKTIALDRNRPRTVLWNQIVGIRLFEEYISDDFPQIEKDYLAFCRQITDAVPSCQRPYNLSVSGSAAVR